MQGNRYLALLLLLAVVANGVLFYLHCIEDLGGYTWSDMAAEYENLDSLEADYEELSALLFSDMEADVPEELLHRWRLLKQVSIRAEEARGYGEYLQDLQAETRAKLNSKLFPANSFTAKSLQKGMEKIPPSGGLGAARRFFRGHRGFSGMEFNGYFPAALWDHRRAASFDL